MSNIPSTWTTCVLEDLLIALESGSRPKGGVRGIISGIPSIGGEHVTYGGSFDLSSVRYVPEDFAKRMSKGQLALHDILVVKDGATTGKTAFVDRLFPFDKAVVNEHVFICRATELIDPRFLFRYLWSREGQERILENFKGSAQGGINQTFVAQTAVPLAPLNEQHRIVPKLEELLGKVDACQKRLDKIPATLKRFRQSVLAAAHSGRLTTDWRKENPEVESGEVLLTRIRQARLTAAASTKERNQIAEAFENERLFASDEELGFDTIPDSWTSCRIGAIGTVANGSTPSRKQDNFWGGDIPWVSSGEVHNNIITATRERISKAGYESSSVRLLPRGTTLLAMIGEGKTRGQSAVLQIEATINQNIAAIIITHGFVRPEFLWRWFQFQYEATREHGSGSGPQALNCQRVRELPFALPPLPEQQEIVRRVEELFALADQIEARYKKAKAHIDKLTQSILAKAFSGELVPQDPNDQPADELLKQIREEKAKAVNLKKPAKRKK
jgi:type I restriction enzyme, S subunit